MSKDIIKVDTASLDLIIQKSQSLINTAGNIRGQVERFRLNADKAESIFDKVPGKLLSRKNAEDSTTFIKSLTAQIKEADEVRLTFTRPLDEIKDLIKTQFDASINRLSSVKKGVEPRLTVWLKAEEARQKKEAEAIAAAQAAEAAKLADALRAAGEEDDADEVERLAEMVVNDAPDTTRVYGSIGGGAGLVPKITGQIMPGDLRKFLAWAAVYLADEELARIDVPKAVLNKLAKSGIANEIPGLTVNNVDQARVS